MNNGVEAFRSQLQKELGLSIGPKDPLLALWVSQKELLEQNAERFRLLGPGGLTLAKCSLELTKQFLLLDGILLDRKSTRLNSSHRR